METFGQLADLVKQGGPVAMAIIMAGLFWLERKERQSLAAQKDLLQSQQFERLLDGLNGAKTAISSFRDFLGVRHD